MDILSVVTRVPILVFGVERHDDDFADRINYKYTVAVLVIFAIIVTNRQFGTKQIHCWIPAYFTRNYEEYINDICWVSNTYYISLDQKLPEAEQIRKNFELKYYQWVPFILLSQAFFFYIPHIAWRALSRRSGIDVRDIVEAASNYKSVDKYESRQKYMTYMLTAVDQYVDDPRRRKETRRSLLLLKRLLSGICCISGKFLGNYLMVLYLFIKLAFIGNCICQLFVLNLLLGHEFHKFGFELLDKIINGKGWDTGSKIFPKISMCDFRIREIGNPKVSHRYTVQCVLPINLFNQQIFTFIWFWYGLVLIINIYSLCVWTYRFLPSKRLRYVSRRIEIMRQALLWSNKQQRTQHSLSFEQMPDLQLHDFERDLIKHFVHDYLESDGLFILRVLSSNTSDFVCTELIQELWKYYRKQRKFNRSSEDDDNEDDLNDDESAEFKKSLEDFTDSMAAHNINSTLGENKRNNSNVNMVPKRRMNNKTLPAGYVPAGGVNVGGGGGGGGGPGHGPRQKMVRTRKKQSSIQFKETADTVQQQQQQSQEPNEAMSPPIDNTNMTYNNDPNNQLTVNYGTDNNDTSSNVASDVEQERDAAIQSSSSADQQQSQQNDLYDSKENNNNNNNNVDKDNEYNNSNNNQTGNTNHINNGSSNSHKNSKPANGLMAVVQKNSNGRSSSKNKPLSVISEQFSNIYSKSRKSPTSEKVAIVAMAQNAQIQRLKLVNRTSSLDPNLQQHTDRHSPQHSPQQQHPPPPPPPPPESSTENTSSNNEYDENSQQSAQQRVKLKRPTNFARKLLATDSKQQSDSSGGGSGSGSGAINSPPRQTSSPSNQPVTTTTNVSPPPPPPPQQSSMLATDDVLATYTTTTTTTTNSETILVEDELIVHHHHHHHPNKHRHHHHHHQAVESSATSSSPTNNDNDTSRTTNEDTSATNNDEKSSSKSKYLETET